MEQPLKMIQVYAETHEKIKRLALEAKLPVRKYMEKLAKEKEDETIPNSNRV